MGYHEHFLENMVFLMANPSSPYKNLVQPDHLDVALATQSSQKLAALLAKTKANDPVSVYVGHNEKIALPLGAVKLLFELLSQMAAGNAVAIIPIHKWLTTQEAAALLQVSHPYLIKLLEKGVIPFEGAGLHRRIKAKDLFEYQAYLAQDKAAALDELAQLAQDLHMES